MTDAEREVEQKFAGRFFYKKVRTIEGDKKTIRIDRLTILKNLCRKLRFRVPAGGRRT